MRLLKAAAVVTSLLAAGTLQAATWVVSTSGNDANSGSVSSPFRTLNKAAAVAAPGDEVLVRGGVYYDLVSIPSKGTASARISFRPYPNEKAVIDGSTAGAGKDLVTLYKAAFVDFSGFEVRNATKIGICAYGSNNVRISGNDVHHSQRNGIYAGYGSTGVSFDVAIDGNQVHDNVLENEFQALSGGGWAATVVVSRTDRATITGNRVYANYGEGIDAILSDNVVIRGNTVSDSFSVGIYLDNAQYVTVDRNFVYSTGDSRHFRNGHPAAGIQTANESYTTANPLTNVDVTNNIVVNTKWGFYYGSYENGGGLRNVVVANNTFHKASQAAIEINSDAHSNTIVQNNVFSQGLTATVAGGGLTFRNNNWYASTAGAAAGAGDVYGNPSFANAGGYSASDYRLTSASAVLGRAFDASSLVKTDYFGTTRALPFDIGAHQYGNGAAADTQAPSAPGSLRATAGDGTSFADIAWNASSDNVGVTGYTVYRNGAAVATVASTSWRDTTISPSIVYGYQVVAFDAAGNRSAGSNVLEAGWSSSGATEPAAPTAPTQLRVVEAGTTSIMLAWQPAALDAGATTYRVYRDGLLIGSTSGTLWTDRGLAAGTKYEYRVTAVDASGKESVPGRSVSAKTAPASRRRAV